MAVERPPGAIRFMFGIKMQHYSCDFAPVSTLRIRVEQAPSIYSAWPRCARLEDTSYSFDRAHVHLNLVDMTAPCAAKRPMLEAHARRCSAQNFRARLAHRAADLRDGGRQYRFFNL
jgi:hypothetical protein